jgi:hypothetical protein
MGRWIFRLERDDLTASTTETVSLTFIRELAKFGIFPVIQSPNSCAIERITSLSKG